MQLVETAENPIPPGAQMRMLTASDRVNLRCVFWPSRSPATCPGTIVLCQGRSEFIEKYFEVVEEFLNRGFCVVAFDWRGQGGSDRPLANRRKGHVDDFAHYWRDIAALEQQLLIPDCPKPWFALGHSMGGAILLDMAGSTKTCFERLVLTAPMIDIHGLKFPRASRVLIAALDALGLGGTFAPGGGETAGQTLPFAGNLLTTDPRRYARTAEILAKAPELGLGHPTIGWLDAAFRMMNKLSDPEFPRRTLTPTLILGAGHDRIVDLAAVEAFAHRLKAGRLVILAHCEHEILVERDIFHAQFWAATDAFLPGESLSRHLSSANVP